VTRYVLNLREKINYKLSQILVIFSNGNHVYSGLCAVGLEYCLSILRISCGFSSNEMLLRNYGRFGEFRKELSVGGVLYIK